MRRNLKKFCCAILCICLLLINTPCSMSYAENMEQYATYTDADTDTTTENANVSVVDGTAQAATTTDAEDIETEAATAGDVLLYATAMIEDELLYAAPPDVPEGGYKLEINSQEDWDNLLAGQISGWMFTGGASRYVEGKNPVVIILNTDVTLSEDSSLYIPSISLDQKFLLYGDEHSINLNGHVFTLQKANTTAIENTHIENGTLTVADHWNFSCTNSQFSSASVELNTTGATGSADITGCKFLNCTEPCVYSIDGGCPVSFSDCTMDNCGLLFKSDKKCEVSFSGIIAENCTGTVFGNTKNSYGYAADSYTIKSISGCKLSTSTPGLTAIDYFGTGNSTVTSFSSANYDIDAMSQIYDCTITGFDTGINLNFCEIVVKNCDISDCKNGINTAGSQVAIVDTTLTARDSEANSTGITAKQTCYLIDCNINDFVTGSDTNQATIISCIYENKNTNLICSYSTSVYDTSFIGGESSVILKSSTSYFYGCVVEGVKGTTTSGISMDGTSTPALHIYSLEHPYNGRSSEDRYNILENYSNRSVNKDAEGKSISEISNCEIGIDFANNLSIGDTHIYDCGTGIKSINTNYKYTTSYGNNVIENCTYGMNVDRFDKNRDTKFTDTYVDTIRNCTYGLSNNVNTSSSHLEWENRLEIYNCEEYGIMNKGNIAYIMLDVHDCGTGIYITEDAQTTSFCSGSMIYNNTEWNIYDGSKKSNSLVQMFQNTTKEDSEVTLTGGGTGNIYFDSSLASNKKVEIYATKLKSDDSVYYLASEDGMFLFRQGNSGIDTLDGTIVFDTVDAGYYDGRKIAELKTDITSQMFAKKEGYVIKYEEDAGKSYAVFAVGCDVTYDVTTNGGDTFIDEDNDEEIKDGKPKQISYLKDDTVNLNYKASASKPGYTFVGWNTDKNATKGLDTLTAGEQDITLYAIYEKTATINYHTYDAALDYSTEVTFYNDQDKIELAPYNADGDKNFAGYVLDEDAAVSSADDLLQAGDNVTVSPDGLDVYCVYEKQGQLTYLKKDGTTLSTESKTVYEICSENKEFMYTVGVGESVAGFTFTGWKDEAGNSFVAGDTINTENNLIVLTPVYVENEEPTTEDPTTEEPTTEAPTPEPPIIQPPTTETSTTQPPAGPKTGDSTNPIGVIGLGILSFLGILVLSLKNKRKN